MCHENKNEEIYIERDCSLPLVSLLNVCKYDESSFVSSIVLVQSYFEFF